MFKPFPNYQNGSEAEQIVIILARIYAMKLTTSSGGNISIKDTKNNIWITPASIDKSSLTKEDIVCVSPDGSIVGQHKPSSELPFHQAIYNRRSDISVILHAHPDPLVAFSATGKAPDVNILYGAKKSCESIGFVKYALPGSDDLGHKIADTFAKGFNIVLLENHGVVSAAKDMRRALAQFEELINLARIQISATILGGYHPIATSHNQFFDETINKSLNKNNDTGALEPTSLNLNRSHLCNYQNRSYLQGLFTADSGIIAIRTAGGFLLTPEKFDRASCIHPDLISIDDHQKVQESYPGKLSSIVLSIFDSNPDINVIFFAQPPHLMGFNVSQTDFNSRIIPEAYMFLRDVIAIESDKLSLIADYFSASSPLLMVKNLGVFVTGENLFQAYDRLELAEFTAKALISAIQLGNVNTISDKRINELIEDLNLPH